MQRLSQYYKQYGNLHSRRYNALLCVFTLPINSYTHEQIQNHINFKQYKKGESTGNKLINEWELMHTDIFIQSYVYLIYCVVAIHVL